MNISKRIEKFIGEKEFNTSSELMKQGVNCLLLDIFDEIELRADEEAVKAGSFSIDLDLSFKQIKEEIEIFKNN